MPAPDDRPGWERKAWGWTREEFRSDLFSRHDLRVERGGFCSVHWHEDRANRFIVKSGRILVALYRGWRPRIYELGADNVLDVASREVHQFLVLEAGVVLEDYWPDRGAPEIRTDDIHRLIAGGTISEGYASGVAPVYDDVMDAFCRSLTGLGKTSQHLPPPPDPS